MLGLNVRNILQNIISPTKHCYGSEECYEAHRVLLLYMLDLSVEINRNTSELKTGKMVINSMTVFSI